MTQEENDKGDVRLAWDCGCNTATILGLYKAHLRQKLYSEMVFRLADVRSWAYTSSLIVEQYGLASIAKLQRAA
eukprot:CAMPEP_0117469950 /NCGR_PEP_ID=MMETSP0784-20121206/6961_1 /TAXON_ID=39447 /ORGANISM="" /LENGTH=73 /DNA_ID=CAMNT_0005264017 /DNA_START=72 /DNA_END=294 /DNA_ORIENTATION=+